MLRITVLGGFDVAAGADPARLRGYLHRVLLARLIIARGRMLAAEQIIDDLWPEDPPAGAVPTVRTIVSNLRRVLEPDRAAGSPSRVLPTVPPGYALHLEPDAVDAWRFEAAIREAMAVADSDAEADWRRARTMLETASALWRGEPYAEFAAYEWIGGEIARLRELRRLALEQRFELAVRLGDGALVLPDLESHVAASPLSEQAWRLLVTALLAVGRRAEAGETLRRAFRELNDAGLSPGAALTELEAETALAPDHQPASSLGVGVGPAQLPADLPDFTGRTREAADVVEAMQPRTLAVAAAVVTGLGGVGKTSLAVHAAHSVRDRYPGGQLYADLRGAGPDPADPADVLAAFLTDLGVDAIPDDLDARAGTFRSAVADRGVFVLLDDAADTAQIRPLIPGSPGCAVLVTSRSRLITLPGAKVVDLAAMAPHEAGELFARSVGADRVEHEAAAARAIVRACGLLPLAIRVAAGRLVNRPTWPLRTLADKLSDEQRRLRELAVGEVSVQAVFELGYQQLDTRLAQAFRRLALPDVSVLDVSLASAALRVDHDEGEDLCEALVDLSLLEAVGVGRYRYHDLLRAFAAAKSAELDGPNVAHDVLANVLNDLRATYVAAAAVYNPSDRYALSGPVLPTQATFPTADAARSWLLDHAPTVFRLVRQLADAAAPQLAVAADCLLLTEAAVSAGGMARPAAKTAAALAEAGRKAGLGGVRARALYYLGYLAIEQGQLTESLRHLERAVELSRAMGQDSLLAFSVRDQGYVLGMLGRFEEAISPGAEGAELFAKAGDVLGQALALSYVVGYHLGAGRPEEAAEVGTEAVALAREAGPNVEVANVAMRQARALAGCRRWEEALEYTRESLAVLRIYRHEPLRAAALTVLADIHTATGRYTEAVEAAREGVDVANEACDAAMAARTLRTFGVALVGAGRTEEARVAFRQAMETLRGLDHPMAEEVAARLAELEPSHPMNRHNSPSI